MKSALTARWLLFVSGAAALGHQVIWTRRLVDLLGAGPDTFAKVIGTFFVGLALGGTLSALKPVKSRHAWRRVALAELSVALLALPALFAVPIGDELRGNAPELVIRFVLPVLLVTPAAFAMGLVLPAAVAATREEEATLPLYAANTIGGIFGIGAMVFVLLPLRGLWTAGLAACAMNLYVAAHAGWLAKTQGHRRESPEPAGAERPAAILPYPRLLAFGSGFLVLGLEVVLQQQCAQVVVNSGFSGALVLAFVLAALFLAALIADWLPKTGLRRILAATLAITGAVAAFQPVVFLTLRPGLRFLSYEHTPAAYLIRLFALAVAVIVPVFLAAGFTFPVALRCFGTDWRGRREIAWLLALNGIGGWLGAELAHLVMLPWAGLWLSMVLLAATATGMALLVAGRDVLRSPLALSAGAASGIALAVGALTAARLPQISPVPGMTVAELRVAREGVSAVVHGATNDWRIVYNNTYTLGGSLAQFNQERQSHLPILLHGEAKSVALLGVATGSTTAGAALHPEVTRVDAFELSGTAIRFAKEHFRPFNRDVFENPKVRVIHEDARIGVLQNPRQYDVIIGDLFLPWRSGEGRLFTAEHFAAVRRALRENGLFCQWLPLFQLTRTQFDGIVRTFAAEFPDAFLVRGDFYAEQPIVGLVGGRAMRDIPWDSVSNACVRLRREGAVTDGLVRHAGGVAMCMLGPVPPPAPGPTNTLANGWLEWNAGKNIVGMKEPWFIGIPYAEFVRDRAFAGARYLPADLRAAQDSGQFFLTLEIAAKLKLPELVNLRGQVADRLPMPLQDDFAINWTQWPSRIKPYSSGSR